MVEQIPVYRDTRDLLLHLFHELYEWLAKLTDNQGRWKLDSLIVWIPELVRRLETSENKIAWVVDHWLDRILGGFVTEFLGDTSVSYRVAERQIFKGSRGKNLRSLNTWIKIILCEKWVIPLP